MKRKKEMFFVAASEHMQKDDRSGYRLSLIHISFRIEGDEGAEDAAQGRARKPVQVVQQGHKKHEPAPVHVRRNFSGIIDRKGFVAHAEDEIDFFQAETAEPVQHGNPVEQVSGVEHERHRQRLDGMKGSQKEVYGLSLIHI